MDKLIENIILYYKNYLNKKIKYNDVNIESVSYENIKNLELQAVEELKILKKLSEQYKLYDENYNDFMIAMGKLAIVIENIERLNIDNKNIKNIINTFENIHNDFEELEQINIMKDVYVWKFVTKKEKK